MSNPWTKNEHVVIEFENYAPDFADAQPLFATMSCLSLTEIAPWTNRVPDHEPWPRVMKQDKGEGDPTNNEINDGYKNNVDWIDQYDNVTSPEGRQPIGVVEGDHLNERGPLWRR